MIKRLVLFCCLCLPALAVSAQEQEVKFAFDNYRRYYREARLCTDSAKLEAMKKLRVYFHEHPYRLSKVNMSVPLARCLELLTPEGTFSDMDALEAEFERSNAYRKGFHTTADDRVGIFIGNALDRLCCIADAYRRGTLTADESLSDKVLNDCNIFEMTDEERKQAAIEVLPESLYDAVRYLNEDKFICDVLGEHITSKYTEAKLREWNDYKTQVTQWELDEYLYKF